MGWVNPNLNLKRRPSNHPSYDNAARLLSFVMRPTILMITVVVLGCELAAGGQMLNAGQPMVDFSLEAHDGSTVSSDRLTGTVYLLYFYPKANTPG